MLPFAYLHSLGLSHKKLAQIPVGAAEDFFANLSHAKLASIGIHDDQITKILEKKSFFNPEKIREIVEKLSITIVHRDDETFPSLLRMIPDCPTLLYVRGALPINDACISIVGSRKHSSYAENCLAKIIPELTRSGYTIVSGGAYGIDTVAHTATVKSG